MVAEYIASSPETVELSIVMPARDEAERLPATLASLGRCRARLPARFEVVLVDDGSRDATQEVARRAARELELRIVALGRRRGPGAAVRAGVLAARGARILLCDADGPVSFDDVAPLWAALDRGFDVAAGSRRLGRDSVLVPQPRHRVLIGRVWGALVRLLAPTRVRDTQCGFKLFRRETALQVFSRVESAGFAFHVEALALAEALGFAMVELPVRWHDVPGSKVRLARDPAQMLLELLRFLGRRRMQRPALMAARAEIADRRADPALLAEVSW